MAVEKPKTQREMVEQLWHCILGTNGEGMAEQNKKQTVKLNNLEDKVSDFISTRWQTCPVRRSRAEKIGGWATRIATISAIVTLILKLLEVI